MVAESLLRLAAGESLSADDTRLAVLDIVEGRASDLQVAAFLTALRVRGERVDELVGAARALRSLAKPIEHSISGLLDTCGTGGDGQETFNISTATALVCAGAGVPIAKHGNRAVTSHSGSSDVLAALGVNINANPTTVEQCLRDVGIAFFFAPMWHPAMKRVAEVRRQLGFRTLFNYVGPLANPARAEHQLLGVHDARWIDRLVDALEALGVRSATVLSGTDGLDEVSLAGETRAVRLLAGRRDALIWTAETFGLPQSNSDDWKARSVVESAAIIRDLLGGKPGPCMDIVLANAAAALWTANKVSMLREGVRVARESITSGAARAKLDALVKLTHAPNGEGATA